MQLLIPITRMKIELAKLFSMNKETRSLFFHKFLHFNVQRENYVSLQVRILIHFS